ncbi:MAG: UbiA family prenyltransferase [Microcella sp.]|nr:UbiA family prenyltransferase [Microcella sp.]
MMRRLGDIVGAAHIGPTMVVTVITVAIGAVSGLGPERVAIVGVMMLFNQLSIGWSNDAIDVVRDREAARVDKPVGRGDVSARTIMTLAISAAVLSLLISLLLGPALVAVHLVALASGWAYNAGLKRTIAATACYLVGFGLIPLIVTLAREDPRPAAWWAIAMGALLGGAAHFANVLPDLDDDRRHGIRSLPHRLGARPASIIALVALAIAGTLGVVGPAVISPVSIVGAAATVTMLITGVIVMVRAPHSRALFRVIMVAALAAVVTLAGAAGSIVV